MEPDTKAIRASLKQQLEGDKLMGVASIPMQSWPSRGSKSGRKAASIKEKAEQLRQLDEGEVRGCTQCRLHEGRTQTVFGQGDPGARLVFVGEAPGFQEDRDGLAFVGRAGKLLTDMIVAMGLKRDDVFICNVIKCRPPNNRDPQADEILACHSYLQRQLMIIQPEVLVALGSPAAKTLLATAQSIGALRGRFHEYDLSGTGVEGMTIPLMPTYHPAYLLRNPADKRKVWDDLQKVMALMGLPMPKRTRS